LNLPPVLNILYNFLNGAIKFGKFGKKLNGLTTLFIDPQRKMRLIR